MSNGVPTISKNIRRARFRKPQLPKEPAPLAETGTGVASAIDTIFKKYNYDPLEALVRLRTMMVVMRDAKTGEVMIDPDTGEPAKVPLMGPHEAAQIDKELLKYLHPQKKSVELKGDAGGGQVVILSIGETHKKLALEYKQNGVHPGQALALEEALRDDESGSDDAA